jgi:hypothetical protein
MTQAGARRVRRPERIWSTTTARTTALGWRFLEKTIQLPRTDEEHLYLRALLSASETKPLPILVAVHKVWTHRGLLRMRADLPVPTEYPAAAPVR